MAVTGPARIQTSVSTTSASQTDMTLIVDSSGRIVSDTGAYDATHAGTYGVRVCSLGDPMDPTTVQYTGLLTTGPAGQPAAFR